MCFGPPRRIVSDKATDFIAALIREFIGRHGKDWRAVLSYEPVANRRAERMVGNIKQAIKRSVVHNDGDCAKALQWVFNGYRSRNNGKISSPFRQRYEVNPKMLASEAIDLLSEIQLHRRLKEVLYGSSRRAETTKKSRRPKGTPKRVKSSHLGKTSWLLTAQRSIRTGLGLLLSCSTMGLAMLFRRSYHVTNSSFPAVGSPVKLLLRGD